MKSRWLIAFAALLAASASHARTAYIEADVDGKAYRQTGDIKVNYGGSTLILIHNVTVHGLGNEGTGWFLKIHIEPLARNVFCNRMFFNPPNAVGGLYLWGWFGWKGDPGCGISITRFGPDWLAGTFHFIAESGNEQDTAQHRISHGRFRVPMPEKLFRKPVTNTQTHKAQQHKPRRPATIPTPPRNPATLPKTMPEHMKPMTACQGKQMMASKQSYRACMAQLRARMKAMGMPHAAMPSWEQLHAMQEKARALRQSQ